MGSTTTAMTRSRSARSSETASAGFQPKLLAPPRSRSSRQSPPWIATPTACDERKRTRADARSGHPALSNERIAGDDGVCGRAVGPGLDHLRFQPRGAGAGQAPADDGEVRLPAASPVERGGRGAQSARDVAHRPDGQGSRQDDAFHRERAGHAYYPLHHFRLVH
jgi:hypothetical protein